MNEKDRWFLVKAFFAAWYEPLTKADGYTEGELAAAEFRLGKLPSAVREWYALAGKRAAALPTPTSLRRIATLQELSANGTRVCFYILPSAGMRWMFLRDGSEDPRVISGAMTDSAEGCGVFSEFALAMIANETVEDGRFFNAFGSSSGHPFTAETLGFTSLGTVAMDDNGTSRFWFTRGVVLKVTSNVDSEGELHHVVNITAKTKELLDDSVTALIQILDSVLTG